MSASTAKRRGRIERLRRVAEKRVLAAEVEATHAHARAAEAEAEARGAEQVAERALDAWSGVASAWELAQADARRTTLEREAARARERVFAVADAASQADAALVTERVGEQRLAKVIERLAAADAAREAARERRAGDEHAARRGRAPEADGDAPGSEGEASSCR